MVFAVDQFAGSDGALHNLALDDCVAFVSRAVGQWDDQFDFVVAAVVVVEKLEVVDVGWAQHRQDA